MLRALRGLLWVMPRPWACSSWWPGARTVPGAHRAQPKPGVGAAAVRGAELRDGEMQEMRGCWRCRACGGYGRCGEWGPTVSLHGNKRACFIGTLLVMVFSGDVRLWAYSQTQLSPCLCWAPCGVRQREDPQQLPRRDWACCPAWEQVSLQAYTKASWEYYWYHLIFCSITGAQGTLAEKRW